MPYRSRLDPHRSIPALDFKTVSTLCYGEYCYIVPWAVDIDAERKPWIKKNYPIDLHSNHRHGTATMKLERCSDGYLRASIRMEDVKHDLTESIIDSDLYEKIVEIAFI